MTPVKLKPAAPWSRVKHSTTELPGPKILFVSPNPTDPEKKDPTPKFYLNFSSRIFKKISLQALRELSKVNSVIIKRYSKQIFCVQ